jgi:formate-dependent nitrite reductase membrane component NrfD
MKSDWDPSMWNLMLSNDFGITVFSMGFITWGLIIINLFLLMLVLVHHLFGKRGVYRKGKKK